jgi:lysozyme
MTVHAPRRHRAKPHHAADPANQPAAHAVDHVATPKYTIRGIDVSHHNGAIDWTQVKAAGYTFALAKATDGTGIDHTFTRNWPAIKAAGLMRGAWHYARPKHDAVAQAKHFYKTASPASGDLHMALDLEWHGSEGVSASKLRDWAKAFLDEIQRLTGAPAIFYSGGPFITENMGNPSTNWGCPLWISEVVPESRLSKYMPRAWTDWTFWQWAEMKATPGTSKGAEQDYFKGSLTDLQNLAYP